VSAWLELVNFQDDQAVILRDLHVPDTQGEKEIGYGGVVSSVDEHFHFSSP
jgi:hypothetical protein